MNRWDGGHARHRAPDEENLEVWTDTLPIEADWSEYGRHAAHPLSVPAEELRPVCPPDPRHEEAAARRARGAPGLDEGCGRGQPRAGWLHRLRAARRRSFPWSPAREGLVASVTEYPRTAGSLAEAGRIGGAPSPQAGPLAAIDVSRGQRQLPAIAPAIPTTTMTVTIASPTADLEAATTKLLLQAHERLATTGQPGTADGRELTGLVVSEPRQSTDSYGQVWYWFRGTLQVSDAPAVPDGADDCLRAQASPGGRAALSDGGCDPEPGCERAEEWQARAARPMRAGGVAAVSAWPLRPVPRQYGNGWTCSLPTAAVAARVRRDLRVRLQRASAAGHCTLDAGEDLLLVFEELSSNAFRHAAGAVDVMIAASAAGWLLVISDEAPDRAPVPAMGRDRPLGGLGLEMVAGLSRDFGWQPGRGRKSVWAELPVRG